MKLLEDIQKKLRCPSTKAKLTQNGNYLVSEIDTNIRYPIIDDIPILINNKNSLFSIDDYIKKKNSTSPLHVGKVKKLIRSITPGISTNMKAKENYSALATMLPYGSKILIIGGSIKGYGMESLYSNES